MALAATIASAQPTSPTPPPRFSVSSYSYWHVKNDRYPIEKVIDDAARLGFAGVEVLQRQMTDESAEYLNRLKRAAFLRGVALTMFSIHQDFVSPWAMNAAKPSATPSTASKWLANSAASRSVSTPAAGAPSASSTTS
jgi:L-ribulose-5-phosphate 3-epimerase